MKMTDKYKEFGFGTRAIHAGQDPEAQTGAVMTPIFQTSTFAQKSPGKHQGYEYARGENPTREAYEACLASLEKGKYGLAFSSGLAAIDAVIHLLKSGDHVIACDDLYGGTYRIFDRIYKDLGISISFVDFNDEEALQNALQDNTKLLWLETPTNPLLKIYDIQKVANFAKKNGLISAIDNTFMSAYFQNPLDFGIDIVMHSVTKYMNGHSDVIGGALITSDDSLYEKLKFHQYAIGAVPGPMDCFLVMRGLKTLHLRMEAHQKNASKVAEFLNGHQKVERVIYPGLENHPQHELAKKQMHGFGGMITFFIKGGLNESRQFLENVKIFTLAESLGGVESLIEHPAIMTHASIPADVRAQNGISDNLVRISVGVENADDLILDLKQALEI